ncbi:hypothetical protein K1T71_003326 [Dendrolimus kikuchii]|uniref:Uncharacterized protein n=1 Tax=Dendrolimus kikuchii TaxID=765133 RepID=A0ACC1DBH0_9NEOP|nr:hypothetical protein K1T71_003326 [Dendrolimus kikuchii]
MYVKEDGALEGGALGGGGGGGALGALRAAGSPPAPSLGASRHSLIEMMTCRLGSRRLGGSRGSLQAGTACSAASELDLSSRSRRAHKARLKLLGASGEAPLLGGWRSTPHTPHAPATPAPHHSHNHLATPHCNGTDSGSRGGLRRRSTYTSGRLRSGPHWSFVFDPAGRLCYYWSMVVSLAFLYNLWVIVYRFAFQEINGETLIVWFCLDYFSDFLYLADILFHFRTGYLEDGVLQTDAAKLRAHYMNSTTFYIDCLCLLPLDFLYLSIGFNSILRSFRLVKIYRFWAFMDRTERHTNYPNLFRSTSLIHYLLVIFHWNGCLYHIIYKNNGFGSKNWVYHDTETADVVKQYLQSYYWCTLALTTIGDLPRPRSKGEYVFVIAQLLFGLLLFATVLGHVANIVTSVSTARKEFQAKLDGVKTYMRINKCEFQKVEIFQNTEAGFLCELVLRLRPVLFSPGDYICRKGEVGKEMYIVNRGKLQVVGDNGKTVLATLKAGSYFGEISILNMGTAVYFTGVMIILLILTNFNILLFDYLKLCLCNRRTASVRSVGYSDLFVLSKKDMWDVLKEYPAARVRLEAIAVKRLEKYKKAPLEKVAMGRCQSTPGLVETSGRVPIEEMQLPPAPAPPPIHSSHPPSYRDQLYSSSVSPLRVASPVASLASSARSSAAGGGSVAAVSVAPRVLLDSHEALECEIKRLRERLYTVETENAAMSAKLSQQQWEVDQRLQEIEMQICGGSSLSSQEDNERNRESII